MSQLFPDASYNGPEYRPDRDDARLVGQTQRVYRAMADAKWRTLDEIAQLTEDPVASISAQLRHLRKPRFGAHIVERRSRNGALFEYRMLRTIPLSEAKPCKLCGGKGWIQLNNHQTEPCRHGEQL